MKYKIGEVSKILNIPVETIRFYETKNLIHPEKDENSNYRYYDIWDMNRLLDYKKYRELEFSLNESLESIQSASLKGFTDKLQEKIDEYLAEWHCDFNRPIVLACSGGNDANLLGAVYSLREKYQI